MFDIFILRIEKVSSCDLSLVYTSPSINEALQKWAVLHPSLRKLWRGTASVRFKVDGEV